MYEPCPNDKIEEASDRDVGRELLLDCFQNLELYDSSHSTSVKVSLR